MIDSSSNSAIKTARCRVRHAGVWHSVRLSYLTFSNASIEFAGPLEPDASVEIAVHGFGPKRAFVTSSNAGAVHLMFEDPIPWPDLTLWVEAARR